MHRKINNILAAMVIGFGLFMILAPYMPSLDFWVKKRGGFDVPTYAAKVIGGEQATTDIPTDNRLVIPSIGLDEHIFDSSVAGGINKGVYHQPHTSKPPLGSNTVLVGHRFSYFPNIPAPFYSLDKIAVGDEMVMAWGGALYRYIVKEIKVVEPTETSVEKATSGSMLTIYTCTPLWTASQRLVIISELIGGN